MSPATTERQRRWALYETDICGWSDDDLIAELRRSYEPELIPPCRICGAPLSLQATGGGGPDRWACDGRDENGGFKPGRSPADQHYCRSEHEDLKRGGDERVLTLIGRYEAAKLERTAEA